MTSIKVLLCSSHADGERARKQYAHLDGFRMATSDGRLQPLVGVAVEEVWVTKTAPSGLHYKTTMNALNEAMLKATTTHTRIRFE